MREIGGNKEVRPLQYTAVEAGALPLNNGVMIYVTTTDVTFTSKGIWAVEEGVWVKK